MADRTCACRSDDAATCLRLRCGESIDYDGRAEECSCACHYESDDCPDCRWSWSDCECDAPSEVTRG